MTSTGQKRPFRQALWDIIDERKITRLPLKVESKKASASETASPRSARQFAEPPRSRSLNRRVLKASEQLVDTLLKDIVADGLKPGDRLPQEPEMVAKYGVARATVREALRILEINGLISLRTGPAGGPTVRSVTPTDFGRAMSLFLQAEKITLEELFRARRLIEPILVRDAAEQQDAAYLARAKD